VITNLTIKNYALIEDVRLDLEKGLTIITGETGAGKSILLGALSLLLGKRADLGSVKNPEKKCIIEGTFSIAIYELQNLFSENDLDYEDITIIRREILPGGKSRAFVNDTPVNLNQLQEIAPYLVDIHSQHETMALSSEDFQFDMLDALSNNGGLLREYSERLSKYKNITDSLRKAEDQKAEASKELDYNNFLFTELEEINLEKIDIVYLEETYKTLNNSEEIQEIFSKVLSVFTEEQIGTLETAKESRAFLTKLKTFSTQYEEFWNRLQSVILELEDITEAIETAFSKVEADPEQLLKVHETLQILYKLQQKHSVSSVEELIAIKNLLADKIDVTLNLDGKITALQKERERLAKTLQDNGEKISLNRQKVIPQLKERLEEYLNELGLPNARFDFQITKNQSFKSSGIDNLELLFTANKGLAFGPLKKTASGGELSRIMLAVKAVLARYKKLSTQVFDEIDTGVSGEIARKMANIMAEMSVGLQVISITHLPQIAAKGDHHIKVYKEDIAEVTVTSLKPLYGEERIVEIAQMIGGKNVTETTLANAKELLN